ncbi:MAG: hypothetical protein L0Y58_15690 [Verrucomicrobia subdivision 3 bacterium]|nr:hypothetical protein [Limisphaerales bacterium]
MKPALFVLVAACLGLTASFIVVRQNANARVKAVEAQKARTTADLEEVKSKFTDLEKLYSVQQGTLNMRTEELAVASNTVSKISAELAKVTDELKTAQLEMQKRQEQLTALQTERDDLTKKMDELTSNINQLEVQIAETKRKLETAEGDKSFLLAELNRLQTERETLISQFNSIAAVRAQLAKLKEEAAIKQRIEWKNKGVYAAAEQKGAERLVTRALVYVPPENQLDVEIFQDGSKRIVPAPTNAPAVNAP